MTDVRLFGALAALVACLLITSICLGSTTMPLADVVAALSGQGDRVTNIIVFEIRGPRAVAAALVGAALGGCGAALQGLLRNPLADPGVLGVSASASLGATIALYYGLSDLSAWATPIGAVLGALVCTALLGSVAVQVGSVVTLMLVGVGVSSFAGALTALLMNLAPNPYSLSDMVNWMLGTVANRSVNEIALAAPFLAGGAFLIGMQRRALLALSLGEDAAQSLGVNLAATRALIVVGSGLAIGAAVSLAGAIGFVGLAAAHCARPLVGHRADRALAPAALIGASLLLAADIAVRLTPTESELKLGVVAGLLGAPLLVAIAARRERGND